MTPDEAVEYELRFHDTRPPHEVQFALERTVGVLFTRGLEDDRLSLRATARVNGARYTLTLNFVTAMSHTNEYLLHVAVSWAEHRPDYDDYFRSTSRSWFALWTRDLDTGPAPRKGEGSVERYRALAGAAMRAEADLDSVTALQQAVLEGVQRGGRYLQSHKEGGTDIAWRDGAFVRTDYGDNPGVEQYTSDASFLQALRQFCHWDVMGHAAEDEVSDIDTWRLILRRMETG